MSKLFWTLYYSNVYKVDTLEMYFTLLIHRKLFLYVYQSRKKTKQNKVESMLLGGHLTFRKMQTQTAKEYEELRNVEKEEETMA